MICNNGITIDRTNRTVTHRGRTLTFDDVVKKTHNIRFETACHLLLSAGISKEQMFWNCYGDDPEGGPLDGPHIFQVVMNRLGADFNKIDIEIRAWRIAGVSFYCAVPKFEVGVLRKQFTNKYIKKYQPPSTNVSRANVVG